MTAPTYARGCARCSWTSGERDTRLEARSALAEHSDMSRHPLCCICWRSLDKGLEQTCNGCTGRVRVKLLALVDMYALLPLELAGRPEAALSMLAPGNAGTSPTESTVADPTTYPWGAPGRRQHPRLYVAVPATPTAANPAPLPQVASWRLVDPEEPWKGTANGLTSAEDPESVAGTLGSWEDAWRAARGEPAAAVAATVTSTSSYLQPRVGWAASEHPAFPDFVDDIARLHRALEDAVGAGSRPTRSEVPCTDCDEPELRRGYRHPDRCDHLPPERVVFGYLPSYDEPAGRYRQRVVRWREGHGCDQGGRVDVWTCGLCGRDYLQSEYWLAVRALYAARRDERGA